MKIRRYANEPFLQHMFKLGWDKAHSFWLNLDDFTLQIAMEHVTIRIDQTIRHAEFNENLKNADFDGMDHNMTHQESQ